MWLRKIQRWSPWNTSPARSPHHVWGSGWHVLCWLRSTSVTSSVFSATDKIFHFPYCRFKVRSRKVTESKEWEAKSEPPQRWHERSNSPEQTYPHHSVIRTLICSFSGALSTSRAPHLASWHPYSAWPTGIRVMPIIFAFSASSYYFTEKKQDRDYVDTASWSPQLFLTEVTFALTKTGGKEDLHSCQAPRQVNLVNNCYTLENKLHYFFNGSEGQTSTLKTRLTGSCRYNFQFYQFTNCL